MGASQESVELFTIGHSNHPLDAFLALLRHPAVRATRLVDVRSAPFSRFAPHFNRDALERALPSDIGYVFAGDFLGGRPTDPTCYKIGVVPDEKADYLKVVDYAEVARRPWFRRGLDRLIEIAAGERTAVMCSEEDPLACHRHHLIADALLEQGVVVRHVRRDGRLEDAAATLRAPAGPQQLSLLG